jgi:hypothetical protein
VCALCLPVLIGIMGLAIDVGIIEVGRRQAQGAADAAAYAGAQELFQSASVSTVKAAATDSLTQNGYTNGVNGVTITINVPPASGPNKGSTSAIEVLISKTQKTVFMSVVGLANTTFGARAVGILGPSSVCAETTGPVGEGIDIDGGFILNAPTCGIVVDSTNYASGPDGSNGVGDQSITTHGGNCSGGGGTAPGNYTNPTGTSQVVVSSFSTAAPYYSQGVCISNTSAGPIITPNFGVQQMPDQLGFATQPTNAQITACDQYNAAGVNGNPPMTISGTKTLNPGSYCGGIWLESGANVTLEPGTYILNGGNTEGASVRTSLEVDGGATMTGSGVTFFNTGSTTPCPNSAACPAGNGTAGAGGPGGRGGPGGGLTGSAAYTDWAPILLCSAHLAGPGPTCPAPGRGGTSDATVTLSAPTSGSYSGILFFDARTLSDGSSPCGGTNANHETCAKTTNYMQTEIGGPDQSFTGTFYFPTTQLNFEGGPNATTGSCSPFVGWILLWNIPGPFNSNGSGGGLTINANCGGVAGGNPLRTPALGE